MRRLHLLVGMLISIFILSGCETLWEGDIEPYEKTHYIYATYEYPTGGSPSFVIDVDKSSQALQIKAPESYSISGGRVFLEFPAIQLIDALGIYQIANVEQNSSDFKTEEWNDGEWEEDTENFLYPEQQRELNIMIVLDVSSSLGGDVNIVKSSAIEFVNSTFATNPNARIGVVGFSNFIQSTPLSSNQSAIRSFIQNLQEDQNATKLYEAIDEGLGLLNGVPTGTTALVVFTDGKNNAWSDIKYSDSNYILQQLRASGVRTYTIGYTGKGGVDSDVLESLAVNDGDYVSTESSQNLSSLFEKIANSVASSYTFVYERNDSRTPRPLKLRISIKTQLF